MLRRLLFGPVHEPEHHDDIEDLKPREWLLLSPIAILCVVIGVYPQPILRATQPDVDRVVDIANRARQRAASEQAQQTPDRDAVAHHR
jgi:NADH:ubiquinone oxidoreductase subunit 4 (subunit M)